MRMLLLTAGLALAACGSNEEQIRADERAKVLEERVAQLEAERDAAKEDESAASAAAPTGTQEVVRDSTGAGTPSGSELRNAGGAVSVIASYQAYIGGPDLYNSAGKRLDRPWQILRQDRANVHRFGKSQRGDQSDPFFASAKNREIMERMVANGSISPSAARRIVQGDVIVEVDILGDGDHGRAVNVTVY